MRVIPNGVGALTIAAPQPTSSTWRFGFVAVMIGAGVLFFGRLGDRSLWSEEVRWAEIARGMDSSGDYLWPTINGHTYYDKPLGSYWLVLPGAWMRGQVDEVAARLPCAVSGLLAVGMMMLITQRLYGARTSLLAGAALATSFGFVVFSRTASSDLETVAGVLVALWLCLRNENRGGRNWIFAFWLVMALTSLTKGLLGFVLPLLIFGAYRLLDPDLSEPAGSVLYRFLHRHRWLFNWVTPLAFVAALAVYAAPFFMSSRSSGPVEGFGMVWRENVQRFFDTHNHRGPVYLYVYVLFGLAAPWATLLPAALIQAHAKRTQGDRFALAYFWAVFIFFTLSSSRRSYYLLPILPAVSMLIGRLLATPVDDMTRWARRFAKIGFSITATSVLVGAAAYLVPRSAFPAPWNNLPDLPAPWAFGVCWLVAVVGVIATARKFSSPRLAAAFVSIAFSSMGYLFLFAQPDVESYRTQQPFLIDVRELTHNDVSGVALYRTRETVFYLAPPRPLLEPSTAAELQVLVQNHSIHWLLARERDLPEVGFVGSVVLREPAQPWEGSDVRAGKLVLLEIQRGNGSNHTGSSR